MPATKIVIVLVGFLAAFAVDGANSYLHLFPNLAGLYEPTNWLRLFTGTALGMGIAAVLIPVLHQTLWRTYDPRPALAGWREFLPLLGLAAVLDAAVLSDIPVILYPLALLSAASIFMILSMVYGIVWILITKRDNRFDQYRQLWIPLTAGLLTATMQIGLFDAARYWLTGTWAGFKL
jgi:hypothetical protein